MVSYNIIYTTDYLNFFLFPLISVYPPEKMKEIICGEAS
jgi:hypothetical protein